MSKNIKQGKEICKNVESFGRRGKILVDLVRKNFYRLKESMKIPDQGYEKNTLEVFYSVRKSGNSATNKAKMRKKAVKNLLVRKVNSPCNVSPSLSCSSID